MNIDRLQELWKSQSANLPPLPEDAALLAKIKADSTEFDLMIRRRDRRELMAGLKYAGFFAVLAAAQRGDRLAWVFAAAAGCMAAVMFFLLGEKALARVTRRSRQESLMDELGAARAEVGRQIWLLRNVAWWYVLPAQVAWWLFALGVLGSFPWTLPLWAVSTAMTLWTWYLWTGARSVWRLNQQAVADSLEPRRKELDVLTAGLGNESPADGSGGITPTAP